MFTRKRWNPPTVPQGLDADVQRYLRELNKSVSDYLLSLEAKGSLTITESQIDSSPIGSSSKSSGSFTTVSATGQISSTLATGTPPLSVSSTTKVTNLNVDFLDDQSGAYYQNAGNLNAGTIPDARFPSTLPAISGANLTNLDAADLATGIIPDARNTNGTYTPTATRVANVSGETLYATNYVRVGGMVIVSGRIDINATAAGSATLSITLPISSNLGAIEDLGGAINQSGGANTGSVLGDATNNRCDFVVNCAAGGNNAYSFVFMYRVI